jgi:hypothetical protein
MGVYFEADIHGEESLGDKDVVRQLDNAAHIACHCVSGSTLWINSDGLSEHILEHLTAQAQWPGGWLVREVFGNPFSPVAFAPEWRTETVIAIARDVYEDRAFHWLPILGDALEDAGCDAAELLAHCRGGGPHVLGCWTWFWTNAMSRQRKVLRRIFRLRMIVAQDTTRRP